MEREKKDPLIIKGKVQMKGMTSMEEATGRSISPTQVEVKVRAKREASAERVQVVTVVRVATAAAVTAEEVVWVKGNGIRGERGEKGAIAGDI